MHAKAKFCKVGRVKSLRVITHGIPAHDRCRVSARNNGSAVVSQAAAMEKQLGKGNVKGELKTSE